MPISLIFANVTQLKLSIDMLSTLSSIDFLSLSSIKKGVMFFLSSENACYLDFLGVSIGFSA
jgi:hypothetical protein